MATKYYQIANSSVETEAGYTVQDVIFKMNTSIAKLVTTGTVDCEYRVYKSKADKDAGLMAFKLRMNGERVKNISSYSLAPWGYEFGTQNYVEIEKQMISDTFNIPIENITALDDI